LKKKAYYQALEQGQKSNDITDWIIYFINIILDAQKESEVLIKFTLSKVKFFDAFKSQLNIRQSNVLNRMF